MPLKISEAFDKYIKYASTKNLSDSHIAHVQRTKRDMLAIVGDKNLSDLNLDDVFFYHKRIRVGKHDNTVRNYMVILRTVLGYSRICGAECLDKELIPLQKPIPASPSFLTASEVSRLIQNASDARGRFVISFLYSSGVRVSEFISLKRDCVKDGVFSVVGKNKKERVCFVDSRTLQLMDEYFETRDDNCDCIVSTRRTGVKPRTSTIRQIVHTAAVNSGMHKKITPHTLRHSFATNLLHNECDIRYISDMLGHSSIETTAIYTHVFDGELRKKYLIYHSV